MQRRDLELFADDYQFYLQDEDASGDLADAWTAEAVERLMAVAPGMVGVRTISNGQVPVAVEVLEHARSRLSSTYDQVNECSLDIVRGPLVVAGWADDFSKATRIPLAVGSYRARVSYRFSDEESYLVQIWPAPAIDPTVVKARAA